MKEASRILGSVRRSSPLLGIMLVSGFPYIYFQSKSGVDIPRDANSLLPNSENLWDPEFASLCKPFSNRHFFVEQFFINQRIFDFFW